MTRADDEHRDHEHHEHRDDETPMGFPAVELGDGSCDLIWASGMWVTDAQRFTAALRHLPGLPGVALPGTSAAWKLPGA